MFIRLVRDILNAIKDVQYKLPVPRKTQNTRKQENTYPVKIRFLQNDLCDIIKEISNNEPLTISKG